MRIIVKPGVVLGEINIRLFHVCITVDVVFSEYELIAILTSGSEGKHTGGGKTSLHYEFLAWDFRLRHVPIEYRKPIADKIREMLNAKNHDYDVILEKSEETEWLHIEYDPKLKEV